MKTLLATLALCATATAAAQDIALLNIRQKEVGHIRQIATDDALGIAAVNDKGELWQWHDSAWHKLADGFAAHTPLSAGHGRITGADAQGRFVAWQNGKLTHSDIALAPDAGMVQLALATIAVTRDGDQHHLVRIENGNIVAKRQDVDALPDVRPLQIAMDGKDNTNGHIAFLAAPSSIYDHAVLGDGIEAQAIHYVERHTLEDLAAPITLKDPEVFEANTLIALPEGDTHRIVSVISGSGARVAVIGKDEGKLAFRYQGPPLTEKYRWLSPFVRGTTLYSVQTPHRNGELWRYRYPEDGVDSLDEGFSNHSYTSREMNLAVSTALNGHETWLPYKGYHSFVRLDAQNRITDACSVLLSPIIMSKQLNGWPVFLLENGEIYLHGTNADCSKPTKPAGYDYPLSKPTAETCS